jgi:hypothetical protein
VSRNAQLVAAVAGGLCVAASGLTGWFVDPQWMIFGPAGYRSCYDLPCGALHPSLPWDLAWLGVTTVIGMMAALATSLITSLLAEEPLGNRLLMRRASVMIWLVAVGACAAYVADAMIYHSAILWADDSESGFHPRPLGVVLFVIGAVLARPKALRLQTCNSPDRS